MIRARPRWLIALAGIAALAIAVRVEAQFRGQRSFGFVSKARPQDFDGLWHFCRVAFSSDPRGDGANWSVDYPRADINLSIRLSELTKTPVSREADGEPRPLLFS